MPFGKYKPCPSMKPKQAEVRLSILSNRWSPEAPSGQHRANIMLIAIKMRLTSNSPVCLEKANNGPSA